jgi:hypothetical protein
MCAYEHSECLLRPAVPSLLRELNDDSAMYPASWFSQDLGPFPWSIVELIVEPRTVASVVAELPGVVQALHDWASIVQASIVQAWDMETGLTLGKEAEQRNRKAADRSVLLCDDARALTLVSESYLGMRYRAREMAYFRGAQRIVDVFCASILGALCRF